MESRARELVSGVQLSLPGNCGQSTEKKKSNMEDEAVGATDNIVTEFATYEDFLDSQITPLDLFYLEVSVTKLLVSLVL